MSNFYISLKEVPGGNSLLSSDEQATIIHFSYFRGILEDVMDLPWRKLPRKLSKLRERQCSRGTLAMNRSFQEEETAQFLSS